MRTPSLPGLSRRASLLSLGAAGVAVAAPRPLAAKKSPNFRCKRQVGQCQSSLFLVCEGPVCPVAIDCCDSLATCNFTGFVACLHDVTLLFTQN